MSNPVVSCQYREKLAWGHLSKVSNLSSVTRLLAYDLHNLFTHDPVS